MRNPIEQLREKTGLEVEAFARTIDVHPTTVRLVEQGVLRRSRVLWTALERAGYDGRALSKKHEMWLRMRGKQSGSNRTATQAG